MRQKTQTTEYWQHLKIDDGDLTFLDELFLEKECPLPTDELALATIRHRCEDEEASIRRELERGALFQPNETYTVGDPLVFPAFDFALGTVVGTRPGYNPEYGDFTVIQVEFQSNDPPREFASGLTTPHRLNMEGEAEALLWSEEYLTPEELFDLFGPGVRQKLVKQLDTSDAMIQFGDFWINKAMTAEIHVGHLNIAEAMIDISNKPLPTEELLEELDLPVEISPLLQTFSLNHALAQDERFVDVGSTGNILWHLTRFVPPEVLFFPRRLQYSPMPHDRSVLSEELLQLERDIDDEASELIAPPSLDRADGVTVVLTYPHRRVGTLPITTKTRSFFPAGTTQQTMITLVDARSGKEMEGWVNQRHRYLYGLEQWYQDNKIPVGAFIHLEWTGDPFRVAIGFKPRRMRREWVRVAEATDNSSLNFTLRKMPISCEYDETMLVWAEGSAEVDALWTEAEETDKPLEEIIEHVFLELAKLNPQGTVHAKTVYTAVNLVRRCPPAPIFAELVRNPVYSAAEGAHWRFIGK